MIREILWNWLPWVYNKSIDTYCTTERIFNAAYNEFASNKELLFIKNLSQPLLSETFTSIDPQHMRWRCKLNPVQFIDPNCTDSNFKHISCLGFTITIPGYDPIDISDWINDVKWKGTIEPSPHDIFVAWCYEKGSPYINGLTFATVEVITEHGDTIIKGLNEYLYNNSSTDGARV